MRKASPNREPKFTLEYQFVTLKAIELSASKTNGDAWIDMFVQINSNKSKVFWGNGPVSLILVVTNGYGIKLQVHCHRDKRDVLGHPCESI